MMADQSQPAPAQRPLPQPTKQDAPFWEACRQHRLVLPHCRSCDNVWFPAYDHCPRCASTDVDWVPASGRGVVYGWMEMHQRYIPWFVDKIPYNVTVVRLEEGAYLYSNVLDVKFEDLHADMPVEVVFEDVDDTISLPKFRLSGRSAA